MKPEKAIEILEEVKELDDTMYAYNPVYMNALDMAIKALKEIQLYKDNKLCLIPEDVYSRQCSELDAYKEIGTVEECREAVDKQKAKKPLLVSKKEKIMEGDYVHVICPTCGEEIFSCFLFYPWNDSQRTHEFCESCGQAIQWDENLEGMEDD